MYLYETHLHTSPVSRCARASVKETLEFYKAAGYKGVFITNHFIDGNINIDRSASYEERINFYFSDYEQGVIIGKELGIDVFCGVEMSYGGTDFLVYGLDKQWFLAHPEIEGMKKSEELTLLAENGAYLVQAHPFREASYIDHIRLFPRHVHGVEIYNANRSEKENAFAKLYCDGYHLAHFAGSDNHSAGGQRVLGGVMTESPIKSEEDFVKILKSGGAKPFKNTVTADDSQNYKCEIEEL